LRQLREVQARRREMGLPDDVLLRVTLESDDGEKKLLEPIELDRRMPVYGVWPRAESRIMEGNVGYLRLPSMNESAVDEIKTKMDDFRNTHGLVIDVRDNGGGSRDALRWIVSYLMSDRDAPLVANCAKYRLYDGFDEDHLESRFMYREDAPEWTAAERAAIAKFRQSFLPEWNPPPELFSDWHYMVLSRLDDPAIYHYSKPAAVLMNGKCFSATDIFLAALKGMPNVTLVGAPSGGGSARAETYRLGDTPISVRLGSMVSFMPNGQLFDTHGVTPDVVLEPEPGYFVGESDNTLDAALKLLQSPGPAELEN
jgi:C-terminal processing protease CtpA/Prc